MNFKIFLTQLNSKIKIILNENKKGLKMILKNYNYNQKVKYLQLIIQVINMVSLINQNLARIECNQYYRIRKNISMNNLIKKKNSKVIFYNPNFQRRIRPNKNIKKC